MPIVKNILRRGKLTKQNLDSFDVFVDEKGVVGSLATSEYFKISNVPADFVRGNQFFQLEGSDLLKPEVELKTEILDSEGNPIFHYAKLKRLNERLTSIVVEIYEDVAPGQGKLVLLGELNPERVNVPTEFLNTYNVRFSAPINIDVEKSNTQPIRFFGSPRLDVKENVKGIVKEKPQQSTYEEFTYTISGSGTLSDDGVGFREFFEWIDAPNPIGFTSGSGFDDFSDNLADIKNFQSKLNSSNFNDQEKQNKKKVKSYYSVDPVPSSFIASSISNGPGVNNNKFNLTIETGKLKLLNPHLSVNNTDFPDEEYDKPTTFETSFKVQNSTQLLIGSGYKIIRKSDGKRASVPLSSVNYELTYEQVITSKTEDADYFRSYADITVGNLRTFSGDVYRTKIFSNPRGSIGDSELIADVVLESQQQLVDKNSLSGRENIGIFYSQSIVDNYWITSSEGIASQNDDTLAGSVILSGSVKPYDSSMTFITSQSYDLVRDEDYIVEFDGYFFKSDSNDSSGNTTSDAELEVFLTGSAISSQIQEFSLGTIDNQSTLLKNRVSGSLNGIYNTFKTHNELSIPNTKLGFRLKKGRFALQNVVLRPFADTNFNPGFFKTSVPMPQVIKRGQRYDFTAKFYDINNNEADGVLAHTTQSIIFNGPPQVIADGLDAKLSGSMLIGESLEMYGVNPAYLRSVGYNGFDNTISNNKGGFMLFSGSVGTRITASESYEGVGLEIVDAHSDIDRYLKFRTNPSQFEVVTDTFFFGRDGQFISGSGGTIAISSSNFFLGDSNGAFISGSQGNLQISSSNFSVDVDGNVTMSGFVSASGGHIGNFQIVEGKISGSNITMDANTSTIFKTDQGPGSDTSAPFDQLRDEYYIDFTPTEESPNNYYIKFGPNFMVDKDGILIASGATFEGSITASTGLIGGFTIGSASLFNGSEGTPNFFFSGSANGSNFDKGNLFISSSGFQVNSQGAISASSGQIGGFNINTETLTSDSNELIISGSSGQITGSTVLFTGGKVGGWTLSNSTLTGGSVTIDSSGIIRSATDLTTGDGFFLNGTTFRIGNATGQRLLFDGTNTEIYDSSNNKLVTLGATNEIAGWTIGTTTISKNNLILNSAGQISSQGYASNQQGFFLGMRPLADGSVGAYLEVDEAQIRGTLKTTVFEKESVNAVGGQLHIANSTTITGSVSMSATETTMSVANVSGFSVGEIIQLKKFNPTGFTTEYMKIENTERQDAGSNTNFSGSLFVERALGTSAPTNTVSGSIGFSGSSAQSYTPGQVIVSTGKIGTGYIRLNANPNDATTPYMDIVERTGSGVYDVDLKARLGDLSGITDTINGTAVSGFGLYTDNAFLKGGIVANYGSIGGLEIESNKIYFGNGTFGSSTFYVDNSGQFSLGNKLSWNGSALSVSGTITITGGDLAGVNTNTISGSFNEASSSFSTRTTNAESTGSTLTIDSGSLASSVKIEGTGISIDNRSGTSLALLTNTLRIGRDTNGQSRLEIDSSGNLSIINKSSGGVDSNVIQLLANGNASFSGSGTFGGEIQGSSGEIGGFSIAPTGLTSTGVGMFPSGQTYAFTAGTGGTPPFRVTHAGVLTATGATINGTITLNALSDLSATDFYSDVNATTGSLESFSGSAQGNLDTLGQHTSSMNTRTGSLDTLETRVVINNNGMHLRNLSGDTLATYGTNIVLGTSGSGEENVFIDNDSVDIRSGTTVLSTFGSSFRVGLDASDKSALRIDSSGNLTIGTSATQEVSIDNNGNATFSGALNGGTISIGTAPNIFKADSNGIYLGNGTFASAPFRVAPNGALTAENITATGGTIAGWAIGSDTLQKLSGNAGVILDAGNSRISVSGSSSDTTGNSVVLDGGIGIIQVSQSGEGVFDTGRTRSFVTRHLIEPDIFKPGQPQAYVSESTTTTLPAPRFDNIDISSNLNVAGLARVEDSLFVDSTNADTAFSFVNQINRATAATNPDGATRPTASFAVNHTTNYSGNNQNSNCHPAFVFSANYFTELEADNNTIGWVQNSVPSGSNIFTIQARLDNHDNTDFEDAKFNVLGLETNTSGIAAARQNEYTFLQAKHSGSIRVQIQHDGDIVSKGNITGFASSFLTVSDKREKKDIYNISDSLDKILQLRPTHFTWIETDKPDVGFIAQEVEEVIPEVVETTRGFINTDDDKERKTISYPKLIPYLVDTIQTLTKRIEELEKQNTKIEVD